MKRPALFKKYTTIVLLAVMLIPNTLWGRIRNKHQKPVSVIRIELPQSVGVIKENDVLPTIPDFASGLNCRLSELSPEAQALKDSVMQVRALRLQKLMKKVKCNHISEWEAYMDGYEDGYEDGSDLSRNERFDPRTRQEPYYSNYREGYSEGYHMGFSDYYEDYILEGWVEDDDDEWDEEEE